VPGGTFPSSAHVRSLRQVRDIGARLSAQVGSKSGINARGKS
jgi:hypothetical protein